MTWTSPASTYAATPREVVVAVSGEIDLAKHQQLADSLETAVKTAYAELIKKVVVDLSQTSFLDSGGIRALVNGRQAADAAGIEYLVTGYSGMVHTVLEVTGVLAFLTQQTAKPQAV